MLLLHLLKWEVACRKRQPGHGPCPQSPLSESAEVVLTLVLMNKCSVHLFGTLAGQVLDRWNLKKRTMGEEVRGYLPAQVKRALVGCSNFTGAGSSEG